MWPYSQIWYFSSDLFFFNQIQFLKSKTFQFQHEWWCLLWFMLSFPCDISNQLNTSYWCMSSLFTWHCDSKHTIRHSIIYTLKFIQSYFEFLVLIVVPNMLYCFALTCFYVFLYSMPWWFLLPYILTVYGKMLPFKKILRYSSLDNCPIWHFGVNEWCLKADPI